jgi:SAM-dependent methyltransferase
MLCEVEYLLKYKPFQDLRILECGSAHKFSAIVRKATKGSNHIGVDMQEGEYVDLVHNLNEPLDIEPVDVVICFSVLEHCDKPWLVAENLENILKSKGKLLTSTPYAWRHHGYPNDYFRFTYEGIKLLFPNVTFEDFSSDPKGYDIAYHPVGRTALLMMGVKNG